MWSNASCDASSALVPITRVSGFEYSSKTTAFFTPIEDTSMKKSLLLASLIAAMALAACGKKEEAAVEAASAASEAASAVVEAASAVVEAASAVASDAAPAASDAASAASN